MPELDPDQHQQQLITPLEFEERKRTLKSLDAYSQGIVDGVQRVLEAGLGDKQSQARSALATFDTEAAERGLDRESLDYELAVNQFKRQLSQVVGESHVVDGDSSGNGEVD